MTGSWTVSATGTSSAPSVLPAATRWALYDSSSATRNRGRQSASKQATSRVGRISAIWRAKVSSRPRTAFTGVPSGERTDRGTPWKARKYSDGVSSSISRPVGVCTRPA